MSQNFSSGGSNQGQGGGSGSTGSTGGAGSTTSGSTGSTTSSSGSTSGAGQQGLTPSTSGQGTGGGTGAGTATGLAQTAQEYGKKVAEAASTAREYVTDKVSVVGDKIGELRNKDFSEVATEAKDYARQNPGQALLISAAAGFVLGLLIRGSRR